MIEDLVLAQQMTQDADALLFRVRELLTGNEGITNQQWVDMHATSVALTKLSSGLSLAASAAWIRDLPEAPNPPVVYATDNDPED